MEFQSVQYTIDTLIQRVRTSRLALPDFQRDFVWNPSKVVELLDSVARQWPIGSLLLLSGPQPFAIRAIDSGPVVSADQLDLYILDGQQRVTSLYHAITDVSDFCYYIDFNALSNGEEDYISWERRSKFNKQYPTQEHRAKARIALIKEIWDLKAFYSWIEKLEENEKKFEFVSLRDLKLSGLQAKVYKVMAIELDQEIDLEALARIFETLNRTGVRLNAFDLMVASLYPSGFRLRDEWESALNTHPLLRKINPDAIEILKLSSLLIRKRFGKQAAAGVRQGDLLEIDKSTIQATWPRALSLYVGALEYCNERFGVISAEVVPTWSMILGVAAWLDAPNSSPEQIQRWWLHRLVEQYFSQAANTRIVSDFELISDSPPPSRFEIAFSSLEVFREPSRRNGLLSRGLAALLIEGGALDIISGLSLRFEPKVGYRSITKEGLVRRPSPSDSLNSLIIVSDETDRMLGKEKELVRLGAHIVPALASQGVDPTTFERNESYIANILKLEKDAEK